MVFVRKNLIFTAQRLMALFTSVDLCSVLRYLTVAIADAAPDIPISAEEQPSATTALRSALQAQTPGGAAHLYTPGTPASNACSSHARCRCGWWHRQESPKGGSAQIEISCREIGNARFFCVSQGQPRNGRGQRHDGPIHFHPACGGVLLRTTVPVQLTWMGPSIAKAMAVTEVRNSSISYTCRRKARLIPSNNTTKNRFFFSLFLWAISSSTAFCSRTNPSNHCT